MNQWSLNDEGYQTSGHTDAQSSGSSELGKLTVLLSDSSWAAKTP